MAWAVEHGDSDRALRLVGATYFFRASWPSVSAKRERLERVLALPWAPTDRASILGTGGSTDRLRVLLDAGATPPVPSRGSRRRCGGIEKLGHPSGTAWAHKALAWQHLTDGDIAAARRHA